MKPGASDAALRVEPELQLTTLGVCLGFAPKSLIWSFKCAQATDFFHDSFGIQLIFKPFEGSVDGFAFADNNFGHTCGIKIWR
jgi:hypothetical protein